MVLMSRETGKSISDLDHLRQSIQDILSTSIGSRVIWRDYGSSLADLLDTPMSSYFLIMLRTQIADALETYEPRLQIKVIDVPVFDSLSGNITVRLIGIYTPTAELITIDNLEFTI